MKKLMSMLLVLIMVFALAACGSSAPDSQTSPDTPDAPAEDPVENDEPPAEDTQPSEESKPEESDQESQDQPVDDTETGTTIESGHYTLPSGMELNFSTTVRNDVTGNWRLSTTSSSDAVSDVAMEYYETMFSSDDEIHAVWNATLGTTTCFSVMSGLLFVDTYEYVDGEEHDANLLFTGEHLSDSIIDLATGEPFVFDDEAE